MITVAELQKIKGKKALLGLDIGSKTIGVAVSDVGFRVATPLKTIFRTSFAADMKELLALIGDRDIGAVVAGLPLEMTGQEGERAKITREIGARIADALKLPIYYQDERFSSVAVERFMVETADLSRKKRGKAIDRSAAAYILQGVLDAL